MVFFNHRILKAFYKKGPFPADRVLLELGYLKAEQLNHRLIKALAKVSMPRHIAINTTLWK